MTAGDRWVVASGFMTIHSKEWFSLSDDKNDEGRCATTEAREDGPAFDITSLLARAQPVSPDIVVPVQRITDGTLRDINFAAYGTPVFSKRAAELLLSVAPNDIQLLRSTLDGNPSDRLGINVISEVDCLDVQHSVLFGPIKNGRPSGLVTGCVIPASIGQQQVFRMKYFKIIMVVTARIKNAIESAGLSGASFKPMLVAAE